MSLCKKRPTQAPHRASQHLYFCVWNPFPGAVAPCNGTAMPATLIGNSYTEVSCAHGPLPYCTRHFLRASAHPRCRPLPRGWSTNRHRCTGVLNRKRTGSSQRLILVLEVLSTQKHTRRVHEHSIFLIHRHCLCWELITVNISDNRAQGDTQQSFVHQQLIFYNSISFTSRSQSSLVNSPIHFLRTHDIFAGTRGEPSSLKWLIGTSVT